LSGLQVGSLFEDQKVFDVVVLGTPATRHSVTSMNDLLIDTPGSDGHPGHVRLGDVAQVHMVPVPNVIQHEAVSRYLDIGVNVQGRDLIAVANDIKQRLQQVKFPLEFHAEVFGAYAEEQATQSRMLGFMVAAAIGIFLLLQAAFGGWRLAGLFFLTLPSALLGGVLAAYFSGGVISLGSLIGFLMLFGIAARNGMLLISHYQQLQWDEGERFGPELILRGAKERLAPILMTALATGLALAPLVMAGDIAGYEIVRPMTIVVLGGLITATLLNLFISPILYLHFGFIPEPEKSILPLSGEPNLGLAGD
jgi:Cu/Ag efflux pump CusA